MHWQTGITGRRPRGRRSRFTMKLAQRVYYAARAGLTDAEIAWLLDIGQTTLHRWKLGSETFRRKLKEAKDQANAVVERRLYDRARGMIVRERSTRRIMDGKRVVRTEKVLCERELAPDLGAIKMWLYNRRPDKWRDRPGINQDNRRQLTADDYPLEVEQTPMAKLIAATVTKIISDGAESTAR